MESVQKQLEELGLSSNEVKVYMAALEVGAASAQQLAAKAAVVRPTAYVAIGGLVKRGLMSSHTRGKKQYFQAEKPGKLLLLLVEQKKKIEEQENKLKNLLPELEHLQKITRNKLEVNYYEGWEGLKIMQDTLIDSGVKNLDVVMYQTVAKIEYNKLPADKAINYNIELNKRKVSKRVMLIGDRQAFKSWRPFVINPKAQYKVFSSSDDKTASEIAIFGEYITLISYSDIPYGCLIKSADVAKLMKLIFEGFWGSRSAKVLRMQ